MMLPCKTGIILLYIYVHVNCMYHLHNYAAKSQANNICMQESNGCWFTSLQKISVSGGERDGREPTFVYKNQKSRKRTISGVGSKTVRYNVHVSSFRTGCDIEGSSCIQLQERGRDGGRVPSPCDPMTHDTHYTTLQTRPSSPGTVLNHLRPSTRDSQLRYNISLYKRYMYMHLHRLSGTGTPPGQGRKPFISTHHEPPTSCSGIHWVR